MTSGNGKRPHQAITQRHSQQRHRQIAHRPGPQKKKEATTAQAPPRGPAEGSHQKGKDEDPQTGGRNTHIKKKKGKKEAWPG